MGRKIASYQRLLFSTAGATLTGNWMLQWLIFIPLAGITAGVTCIEVPSGSFGVTIVLLMTALSMLDGNVSPLLRTAPVSDRFAVSNLLFVYPMIWAALSAVGAYLILSFLTLTGFFFGATGAQVRAELAGLLIPSGIEPVLGVLFCALLLAGFWFLLCVTAFHWGRRAKYLWRLAVAALFFVLVFGLSQLIRSLGYVGSYYLSDLPALLPAAPVLLTAAVFALGSGLFAWNRCLYLYRSDVSGQRSTPAVTERDLQPPEAAVDPKTKRVVIIAGIIGLSVLTIILTLIVSSGLSNDSGEPIHIETHSASDYAAWNDYQQQSGIPDDLYYIDSGLLLFPETVQPDTVTEHYALLDGSYSEDSWASCTWRRLLVVTLSEEDYQSERHRIEGLSLTHLGQINRPLHDTEHFAWEAYLAVYNNRIDEYEYALLSDTDRQIIYVFGKDVDDQFLPMLQSAPSAVVPITVSNDQLRGYSIYSFWNEEDGCCETWWPDEG